MSYVIGYLFFLHLQKGADQLRRNHAAYQRLCIRYIERYEWIKSTDDKMSLYAGTVKFLKFWILENFAVINLKFKQ